MNKIYTVHLSNTVEGAIDNNQKQMNEAFHEYLKLKFRNILIGEAEKEDDETDDDMSKKDDDENDDEDDNKSSKKEDKKSDKEKTK